MKCHECNPTNECKARNAVSNPSTYAFSFWTLGSQNKYKRDVSVHMSQHICMHIHELRSKLFSSSESSDSSFTASFLSFLSFFLLAALSAFAAFPSAVSGGLNDLQTHIPCITTFYTCMTRQKNKKITHACQNSWPRTPPRSD